MLVLVHCCSSMLLRHGGRPSSATSFPLFLHQHRTLLGEEEAHLTFHARRNPTLLIVVAANHRNSVLARGGTQ